MAIPVNGSPLTTANISGNQCPAGCRKDENGIPLSCVRFRCHPIDKRAEAAISQPIRWKDHEKRAPRPPNRTEGLHQTFGRQIFRYERLYGDRDAKPLDRGLYRQVEAIERNAGIGIDAPNIRMGKPPLPIFPPPGSRGEAQSGIGLPVSTARRPLRKAADCKPAASPRPPA